MPIRKESSMQVLFVIGFFTGMLFYCIKLAGFYMATNSKYTRWIRNFFHSSLFGLFILDILAGMVATGSMHSVGADGLTALFIFIGFSFSSIMYIVFHVISIKAKEVYQCHLGR